MSLTIDVSCDRDLRRTRETTASQEDITRTDHVVVDVSRIMNRRSVRIINRTIAIEVTADEFLVHGLTAEGAAGVIDSDMDARVAKCEGNN